MMDGSPELGKDSLDYSLAIGLLEADLLLPLCRSLKAKRGIIKGVLNNLRKQFALSVAEVADHDRWGRAGVAAVTVSNDRARAERVLRNAVRALERDREVQLSHYSIQIL